MPHLRALVLPRHPVQPIHAVHSQTGAFVALSDAALSWKKLELTGLRDCEVVVGHACSPALKVLMMDCSDVTLVLVCRSITHMVSLFTRAVSRLSTDACVCARARACTLHTRSRSLVRDELFFPSALAVC